jgi:hypothetical protein
MTPRNPGYGKTPGKDPVMLSIVGYLEVVIKPTMRWSVQVEKIPAANDGEPPRLGKDLPADERRALLTERIKAYSQRVYKRVTSKPETDTRIAGVCQRENGFYIDTVRSFRDRRYEYKGLVKRWKASLTAASAKVRTCHHCLLAKSFASGRFDWGGLGASVNGAQQAQAWQPS